MARDRVLILGVDPGASQTGLTLVDGKVLALATVVERQSGEGIVEWIGDVVGVIQTLWLQAAMPAWCIGVESVVPPNVYHEGKKRPLAPKQWLIDTAAVMGAVIAYAQRSDHGPILVRPASHGEAPLGAYPSELVSDREPKGTGRLRHCRSAYDIALAAQRQLKREELEWRR